MITFQKLSAKHYGVDEFNYTDVLNFQTQQTYFGKSVMLTRKNIFPPTVVSGIPQPIGQQILIRL